MRSSVAAALAALMLAGCVIEHGNAPPARREGATGFPPGAGDSAAGSLHAVFARSRDTVATGVTRETVSMLVPWAERDSVRAALEAVANDARRDTTVAALRVLGYLPPVPGHGDRGGPGMVPFAYLEWVPVGGWDGVSAHTAHFAHHTDVVFMGDLHRQARRDGPQ
jgi:hypothetical protein